MLTIFYVEADIDLMENYPQVVCFRIRDHDKFHRRGSLVVMKLIVSSSIRYKTLETPLMLSTTSLENSLTYPLLPQVSEPCSSGKRLSQILTWHHLPRSTLWAERRYLDG